MQAKKIAQIQKQIAKLVKQEQAIRKSAIKGVLSEIKKLMVANSISIEDVKEALRGSGARRRGRPPGPAKAKKAAAKGKKAAVKKVTRAKAKPKYRSPENRKITWSGRGRKPAWVAKWIAGGKKLDDLLIK